MKKNIESRNPPQLYPHPQNWPYVILSIQLQSVIGLKCVLFFSGSIKQEIQILSYELGKRNQPLKKYKVSNTIILKVQLPHIIYNFFWFYCILSNEKKNLIDMYNVVEVRWNKQCRNYYILWVWKLIHVYTLAFYYDGSL